MSGLEKDEMNSDGPYMYVCSRYSKLRPEIKSQRRPYNCSVVAFYSLLFWINVCTLLGFSTHGKNKQAGQFVTRF